MPITIRLSNKEQAVLAERTKELNRALIKAGCDPVKESEVVHQLLCKALESSGITETGEVTCCSSIPKVESKVQYY